MLFCSGDGAKIPPIPWQFSTRLHGITFRNILTSTILIFFLQFYKTCRKKRSHNLKFGSRNSKIGCSQNKNTDTCFCTWATSFKVFLLTHRTEINCLPSQFMAKRRGTKLTSRRVGYRLVLKMAWKFHKDWIETIETGKQTYRLRHQKSGYMYISIFKMRL
jgi:hypothetical protein